MVEWCWNPFQKFWGYLWNAPRLNTFSLEAEVLTFCRFPMGVNFAKWVSRKSSIIIWLLLAESIEQKLVAKVFGFATYLNIWQNTWIGPIYLSVWFTWMLEWISSVREHPRELEKDQLLSFIDSDTYRLRTLISSGGYITVLLIKYHPIVFSKVCL